MSGCAPIALFVYNRPSHTRKTLAALNENPEANHSHLYVFSDGAKEDASPNERQSITEVRELVRKFPWNGDLTLIESPSNLGLRESIRTGVDRVLKDHEKLIVLEDDILVSKGFLRYMNDALIEYAGSNEVHHINAFLPYTSFQWVLPETFFHPMLECWGWGTWRRAWELSIWDGSELERRIQSLPEGVSRFNLDEAHPHFDDLLANNAGKMNTWAVFWACSIFLEGGLCLFPRRSLINNIGTDGSGVHFTSDTPHYRTPVADEIRVRPRTIRKSRRGNFYLRSFLIYGNNSSLIPRLCRLALRFRFLLGAARAKFFPKGNTNPKSS